MRATVNRKLREWNFDMVNTGSRWTSYIYEDTTFHRHASQYRTRDGKFE